MLLPNPIINKDIYFKYQNEFRIYSENISLVDDVSIETCGEKIVKPNLSCRCIDFNDIADIIDTSELFEGKKVELVRNYDFCDINNFSNNRIGDCK